MAKLDVEVVLDLIEHEAKWSRVFVRDSGTDALPAHGQQFWEARARAEFADKLIRLLRDVTSGATPAADLPRGGRTA